MGPMNRREALRTGGVALGGLFMLSRSLGNGVSFVSTMKVADGSGAEHPPRTHAVHARGGNVIRPD